MEHLHQRSKGRREIPTDVILDILLRLPTKDFVRSSCVCKLWCSIVVDPSFRKLHVAHHVAASSSGSSSEVLLVTETGEPGRSDEASVFNLSSAKAMCQVAIPSGYSLASVCHGFLCFAIDHGQAPVVVCNPVTGDTLRLPKAPPLSGYLSHLFVLGFSPRTKEYKVFRLSFPVHRASTDENNHIAVHTLGDSGGWREYSYASHFHPIRSPPAPVHIDGNIFVVSADLAYAREARMLVIDVETEAPRGGCLYRIPYNYSDYHHSRHQMKADGFDLNGQMCLAVNVGFHEPRKKTQFWLMKPPAELEDNDDDDDKLHWDLLYSFYHDGRFIRDSRPRGAWIDHDQMLCYIVGDSVHKYDTRARCGNPAASSNVETLLFDQRLELPPRPSPQIPPFRDHLKFCRWNIRGGYRPSLLSPLLFALPPSQDEKKKKRPQLEHDLLRALMVELDEHTDN